MGKIKEFFKHDQIQMSLGLGSCIIIIAYVVKVVLNQEMAYLEEAVPGIVFLFYEVVYNNKKIAYKYKRPLLWNSLIFASTFIVILYKAYK